MVLLVPLPDVADSRQRIFTWIPLIWQVFFAVNFSSTGQSSPAPTRRCGVFSSTSPKRLANIFFRTQIPPRINMAIGRNQMRTTDSAKSMTARKM